MDPHRTAFAALPAAIFAGLLALAAPPALAAHWMTLGKDAAAPIEYDAASVEHNGDKVRVWHRETYTTPRQPESGAFSYTHLEQLTEFQCGKRLAAVLRRIYATDGGIELKTESFDGKDATPVVPDTPADAVLARVCKKPVVKAPEPPPAPPPPPPEPPAKPAHGKAAKMAPPPPPPPAWSYGGKTDGAAKWGKLAAAYALCGNGKRQSPIDLRGAIRGDLPALQIDWKPAVGSIVDDGHGITVTFADAGALSTDGEAFALTRLRVHVPAEEVVDGKRAAMSLQFEHQARSGRIAVLAVPVLAGKESSVLRALLTALPIDAARPSSTGDKPLAFEALLPAKRDYYLFSGSLTTPPCTEDVLWLVLKQGITATPAQIADFARVYKGNVRPLQADNGRVVKQTR